MSATVPTQCSSVVQLKINAVNTNGIVVRKCFHICSIMMNLETICSSLAITPHQGKPSLNVRLRFRAAHWEMFCCLFIP